MVSKRLERGTLGELNELGAAVTFVLDAMRDGDWLAAVEVANGMRQTVDMVTASLVACAREDGASWTAIGERLGVSRQAAWDRFGGGGE